MTLRPGRYCLELKERSLRMSEKVTHWLLRDEAQLDYLGEKFAKYVDSKPCCQITLRNLWKDITGEDMAFNKTEGENENTEDAVN